jgi:DNA polymerase-3 subunit chi
VTDSACEVWFYHLERTSLDQALPELLEKTLARGWKAVVRSTARERLDHLDGWLWSYRDDSFLPHGRDDEPLADRQPVLVTLSMENPNGADALFLIDGAEAGDVAGYARCVLLFDGRDEAAVAAARGKWSTFKAAGAAVSYWRQGEAGGWRKEA